MTRIRIRAAEPDDAAGIRRVAERAWRAAYADSLAEGTIDTAMAAWYDPEDLRDRLARDDTLAFVAVGDATAIVGYALGRPTDESGVASLGALYVDPDRWREGIGSTLLDRFERACRERGQDSLRFRVLASNEIGQSFYRARGYGSVKEETTELFGETVVELPFHGRID